MSIKSLVIVFFAVTLASVCSGEDPVSRDEKLNQALANLPDPQRLLSPDQVHLLLTNPSAGRLDSIDAPEAAYGRAYRIETHQRTDQVWSIQARTGIDRPVAKGDVLLAVFRIRNPDGADGGDARSELAIERAGPPYDKLISYPINLTGDWTLYYLPLRSHDDFEAGRLNLLFRAGYGPQVFEVTDLRLLNFGEQVELADLPRLPRVWPGIEADAPWRAEAARRIDRNRKADLTVNVVDPAGDPVEGATVEIAMTRHAFWFGSAVKFHWIADFDNKERDAYRQKIETLFNHVVNENDLKWPCWAGNWSDKWTKEKSLTALRWLSDRDIHIKGHCIIWPSWKHTPDELEAAKDDPAKMRQIITGHITDLVGRAGPLVDEWDVVNEPFSNHDVLDILGNDAMVDWFRQTRELDPDARLHLNDYGILAAGGQTDTRHQQHFEDTLGFLIDRGAPIGGIGMQSHFGENITPPETLWAILDRFATLGLPIQITEFDVATDDEQLQADYTRDFMTAVFAHEAVNGFVMWGFYEGAHWRPSAAMFRRDWSIKPNGEVYKRLVFDDWWTDETVKTGADGNATVRGFLGDYRITVTHHGKTVETSTVLNKGDAPIAVRID